MFDREQAETLRRQLPDFSLAHPVNAASLDDNVAHSYLEFYGFFETLKAYDLDYFWGMLPCNCGGSKMRISAHFWRKPNDRGTVFLAHGLFDHMGIFQKLTAYLIGQNYSVIAIDLPGHGLSEGGATEIQSFLDYSDVVAQVLAHLSAQTDGRPVYGVGQSTGAAVLMTLCFELARRDAPALFERMIFLGPLVRPRKWLISRWAYRLFGRFIKHVYRDLSFANSHDEEFHNFLRFYDPLQPRKLCISWVGALHQWVETFESQPAVATPTLIIQGTADAVVDWRYNISAIKQHFPNHQVNFVKGAMHHLANEADPWRQAIYNGIGQFLRQKRFISR